MACFGVISANSIAASETPVCSASCERRLEGGERLGDAGNEVRDRVTRYYEDVSTRGVKWWGGQALRYSGAAAAGAIASGGGGAGLGAAGAAGALLTNDIGTALVQSHHDAVTKDLMILANDEMKGALLVKGSDGVNRVNVAALDQKGSLSFLLDPNFYTKIDSDHRQALQFVRENLSIEVLKEVARHVTITQLEMTTTRATVIATYQAVNADQDYLRQLLRAQDAHASAVAVLQATSDQAVQELKLIDAVSQQQLSPRQKLALEQQGILTLSLAEKAAYENDVMAQDVSTAGQHFSDLLSGVAKLPGLSPSAAKSINKANQLVNAGVACAVAYFSGDPMQYMSAFGAVAGVLGGDSGPSPEVQLLQQVLERLDQIEKKIDQYHKEEMRALDQINANLIQVQERILKELRETQLMVLDNSRAIGELLSSDIKACETLLGRYGKVVTGLDPINQRVFANFFESDPDTYADYIRRCRAGVANRLLPTISSIFTPLYPSDSPQNVVGAFSEARRFVQMTLEPTLEYYSQYKLASNQILRNLMAYVPNLGQLDGILGRSPPDASAVLPPLEARLAIQPGGYRLLDSREVITTAATARTVLEMVPSLYAASDGFHPVTRAIVKKCAGLSRSRCPVLPGVEAANQLRDFELLLRVLLLQENLIAGLPAVKNVADVLDSKVTAALTAITTDETGAASGQELFTYSSIDIAHVTDGDLEKPRCSTGSMTLDAICVLQANPFLAANAITQFVSGRLGSSPARLRAYAAALEWEDPVPLQALLGSGVVVWNAALDLPKTAEGAALARRPRWAMLLPRLFADVDESGSTDPAPQSCWDDPKGGVLRISKAQDPNMEPFRDRRHMRCYPLPSSDAVRALAITGRPVVDDAENERKAVVATALAVSTSRLTPFAASR